MENRTKITQKEKELLLRDLSARLPYGLIANVFSYWNDEWVDEKILGIDLDEDDVLVDVPGGRCEINFVKPYLRPMSSMTEEEVDEFEKITEDLLEYGTSTEIWNTVINWLNAKHFDHNGKYDKKDGKWKSMIEMGLALLAPEGMYNFNKEEKK